MTPKDMLSTVLEMDVRFHRGPAFGEHGRTLLPRAFERYVKKIGLVSGQLSS